MTPPVVDDVDTLAPLFRAALVSCVLDLRAAGYPARIFETLRTNERQAALFAEHTTKAATAWKSWHFYGLAADLIHESLYWHPPETFWTAVGHAARGHGLDWGGDWHGDSKDRPHVQWGRCRASPSFRSKALYLAGGRPAVWLAVKAI